MQWLGSNWVWLALSGVFVLFLVGRGGGCGMGHSGHDHQRRGAQDARDRVLDTTAAPPLTPESGEQVPTSTGHAHVSPSANRALASEHAGHGDEAPRPEGRRHHHGC